MNEITVLRAGPLTTVQDQGRMGQRAFGISPGGALDLFAAEVVNLLVGNSREAAVLEITLGGARLRFDDERAIAWAGCDARVEIAGEEIPAGQPAVVRPGEELNVAYPSAGCRLWLAISGGLDLPLILGSRATDLRAGFGGFAGRALRDRDQLSLGKDPVRPETNMRLAAWSAPREWSQTCSRFPSLRVLPGAEWDDFSLRARDQFRQEVFVVGPAGDRMGLRLSGPPLRRTKKRDLVSEAVAPGTIQISPDGRLLLLLGDCQTIGGYPKIAHVITVDLARAAQLLPNDTVRFIETTPAEAAALFAQRAADLEKFRVALELRRA